MQLINKSKTNIIEYIFVVLTILYTARVAPFTQNDQTLIVVFVLTFITFIIRGHSIDRILWITLLIWISINIYSYIVNNPNSFPFLPFMGITLRLLLPYFFYKICGNNFFKTLYKFCYPLIVLSLILFTLQVIFPSVFQSLADPLNFTVKDEYKSLNRWYIVVYMFNVVERNSGFMWEPGAYSCILVFLLYYRLFNNNFKIDRHIIVIIIAIITTFSTSGYLAIFATVTGFLIYSKKFNYFLLLIPIVIFFVYLYNNTSFLGEKIDGYVENSENFTEIETVMRGNRLGFFVLTMECSLTAPLGNGVIDNSYMLKKYGGILSGANGIGHVINQWGWFGVIMLVYTLFKFPFALNRLTKFRFPFIISIIIVLFSNPLSAFSTLIYIIFYYTFTSKKQYYYHKE